MSFVRANTEPASAPLVPEIKLYLATAITPIWQASEDWLQREGVEPPFWAFAWPGSQALARYVLDHPETVRGRRVLDFAAGSGLAAIACARAGAAMVTAAEIDPLAAEAIAMNAALNGVALEIAGSDLVGCECRWDLIQGPMTRHILPWLRRMAETATVWIADPGRAYLPAGLRAIASYAVPTTRELEDRTERATRVLHLPPGIGDAAPAPV